MVLRGQDTQCQRLRDAGQGDEMAWFGRRDGSAAINLRLIDAFPEGVEVLGGWAEPWPLHGRWRTATAAAAMTLERFFGTAAVLHGRSSRKLRPWLERVRRGRMRSAVPWAALSAAAS